MKRMLFNATQQEELRVAIVDGQKLIDLDIESSAKEERKSNIYKAVITRIEPSLEAVFVDYGSERHGFLPFKEIAASYLGGRGNRPAEALQIGQELIVQVEKDERGNKGAALTTYVSLAGRYLVLMPNNPRGGGVSRRVEGEERNELREVMEQLSTPEGMSLIARTAAIGRGVEELQWDLDYLLQLWQAIEGAANQQSGAFLIYQESSLVIRAIRDYFQPDIGEILIDTDDIYEQARQFMEHVMPNNVSRVKRYHDDVPLFSRFQIEHQIESAYARQVNLPSGGAIVIDHTEALVSIDVNSGRATKGADIEDTALRTNCEAADEIARQLRLRDLGGLIVIDFIDMESTKNQKEVESRLRDALRYDRARVQTARISRFGLLELSRQRLRPALAETSYIPCPRCSGTGHIRSIESSALHILRLIEDEAMKENTGGVHVQVPVDVGTFLLNEKRADIARIELRHKIHLIIVPNRHLETPQYEIVRLRHDQLNAEDIALASYQMANQPEQDGLRLPSDKTEPRPPRPEAAVKGIHHDTPPPAPAASEPASGGGLIKRIFNWLTGANTQPAPAAEAKPATPARSSTRSADGESRARTGTRRTTRDSKEDSPRGERSERGESTRRTRSDRADRNDRADRSERSEQPRERAPREHRESRENRNDTREPRRSSSASAADVPVPAVADAAEPRVRTRRSAAPVEQPPVADTPATSFPEPTAAEDGSEVRRRRSPRTRAPREQGDYTAAPAPMAPVMADSAPAPETAQATAPVVEPLPLRPRAEPIPRRTRPQPPVADADSAPAPQVTPAQPTPVQASLPLAAPMPAPHAPEAAPAPAVPALTPVVAPAPQPDPAPAPVVQTATPAAAAPAPAAEPAIPPAEAPAPAPRRAKKQPEVDLAASGLVLIETDRSKIAAAPAVEEPPVRLGRKPRPAPVIADEPLQQVETRPAGSSNTPAA